MILLCGIPSEPPLAMVHAHLQAMEVPVRCFNQRASAQTQFCFRTDDHSVSGSLLLGGEAVRLEEITGVYTRMMDEQLLPELGQEPKGSPLRKRAEEVTLALSNWMEIAPVRVMNRPSQMASNNSKPLQAQLIRAQGFLVPATLITNDPQAVATFRSEHSSIVYKSISGVRSIVQEFRDGDLARIERVRACPVQFQEKVEGMDVRVHVVGTEVFATAVHTEAVDYRYAAAQGPAAQLSPYELDDELAQRCIRLSAALGLLFSGIDLRIDREGRAFCFEVNTSPGFSYYESNTGQPIALAVARLLAGLS